LEENLDIQIFGPGIGAGYPLAGLSTPHRGIGTQISRVFTISATQPAKSGV
jgi:hypothetical protein